MIFIKNFKMPDNCDDCLMQNINGECLFTEYYVRGCTVRDCDCPLTNLDEIFDNILASKGGPGWA